MTLCPKCWLAGRSLWVGCCRCSQSIGNSTREIQALWAKYEKGRVPEFEVRKLNKKEKKK